MPIERGVKQGGPCSAYYFLLIAEILAIEIRKNPHIRGIQIDNILKALGQYADDMDLYIYGDKNSLSQVFWQIDIFCKCTGFRVNYDKTTVYRIGSLKNTDAKFVTEHTVSWGNETINVLGVDISHTNIIDKNYGSLIKKVVEILRPWKKRNLSLHGKTLVINTLVASLFVYKMSVLPSMPNHMIKKLHKIVANFIWESKKAKIALKDLQALKSNGGIALVDFKIKDDSLKVAWINVIESDDLIKVVAYKQLCPRLQKNIWLCNIKPSHVKKLFNDSFWTDVLYAWAKLNFQTPDSLKPVTEQFIWYNSCMLLMGKPFLYNKAYKSGLKYIGQLCDTKGKMLSTEIVCGKYEISVLEYNSIKASMPKYWKELIREAEKIEIQIGPKTMLQKFEQSKKAASLYYKLICERNIPVLRTYDRWIEKMNVNFDYDDFSNAFSCLYQITNVPKLRSFQYKLLYKAVILNDKLCKWGITQTDMCSNCQQQVENVYHFFWECNDAQRIWSFVNIYCKRIFPEEMFSLSFENLLLNSMHQKPQHVINFIFLVAKQYLYASRCLKQTPSTHALEARIEKYRNIEYYNAIKSNNVLRHLKKWNLYKKSENGSIDDYVIEYIEKM